MSIIAVILCRDIPEGSAMVGIGQGVGPARGVSGTGTSAGRSGNQMTLRSVLSPSLKDPPGG